MIINYLKVNLLKVVKTLENVINALRKAGRKDDHVDGNGSEEEVSHVLSFHSADSKNRNLSEVLAEVKATCRPDEAVIWYKSGDVEDKKCGFYVFPVKASEEGNNLKHGFVRDIEDGEICGILLQLRGNVLSLLVVQIVKQVNKYLKKHNKRKHSKETKKVTVDEKGEEEEINEINTKGKFTHVKVNKAKGRKMEKSCGKK